MEDYMNRPGGSGEAESNAAALPVEPVRFSASRAETAVAFLMIIPGYLYVTRVLEPGSSWALPVFAGILILFTEILNKHIPHPKESWFCLSLFVLFTGTITAGRARAFDISGFWDGRSVALLALHAYAVWWIMSRNGCLLEGRSGHLLPADALHAFVIIPFGNFFLRIRTMIHAVIHPERKNTDDRSKKWRNLLWTLAAAAVALWLFLTALKLLTRADEGFGRVFEGFLDSLADLIRLDQDWFYDLLLALPVSAWLFGLIAGGARTDKAVLRMRGEKISARLETMHRVPSVTCAVLTGAFCLLYLAFFIVQAGYLFGAFSRTLPEGFIVSEYARQGFFELCKVMAVNFTVFWLMLRFASARLQESSLLKTVCLILLLESLLFAAVAFSKLFLYIDCFGFTPKRLLSAWLVVVLACGTLCSGYSLLTGKKSFSFWLYFSAGSLVLVSLY